MSESLVPVCLVEDHDAAVERISLAAEGCGEVVFASIAVYRPTDPVGAETEAYEIRHHAARLTLTGVAELTCQGTWEARNSVSDGIVFGADCARLRWTSLLEEQAIEQIELLFTTGGRVLIRADTAVLRLEGEGRFLERWSGPL